jgi:hypothetical protein
MIQMKLSGAESLLRKFEEIKLDMADAFAAGLVAGAGPVVNDAKRNAPIKTGNLMRSYHIGTKGRNITEPQATNGAPQMVSQAGVALVAEALRRGQEAEVLAGTDVVYAPPQEFLHKPHLRPALEKNRDEINAEAKRAVQMVIKRASG